jgi:hypothetical protein
MGTPERENWYLECHQKIIVFYPKNSLPSSLAIKSRGLHFVVQAKK